MKTQNIIMVLIGLIHPDGYSILHPYHSGNCSKEEQPKIQPADAFSRYKIRVGGCESW
jgi:hypothetical protein